MLEFTPSIISEQGQKSTSPLRGVFFLFDVTNLACLVAMQDEWAIINTHHLPAKQWLVAGVRNSRFSSSKTLIKTTRGWPLPVGHEQHLLKMPANQQTRSALESTSWWTGRTPLRFRSLKINKSNGIEAEDDESTQTLRIHSVYLVYLQSYATINTLRYSSFRMFEVALCVIAVVLFVGQ